MNNKNNYYGSIVNWETDDDYFRAKITALFSDKGVTSDVYKVEILDGTETDWVLKIPKEEARQDFIDEFEVLQILSQKTDCLPKFAKVKMNSFVVANALALEFMKPEWRIDYQMFNSKLVISDVDYADILNRVIQLTKLAYDEKIVNSDIKPENFYWNPIQKRMVQLDWNRAKYVYHDDDDLKTQTRIVLKDILDIFYEMKTGERCVNILDQLTVDSPAPEHWRSAWRTIRRSFIDLQKNPKFPISRMKYRFEWQYLLFKTVEENIENIKDLVDEKVGLLKGEKVANGLVAPVNFFEIKEQIFDAYEYILGKNPSEIWRDFFSNIREEIRQLEKRNSAVDKIISDIKRQILDVHISETVDNVENDLINNLTQEYTQRERWKVIPWVLLAELLDILQNSKGLKVNDIPPILTVFENAEQNQFRLSEHDSADIPFKNDVLTLLEQISEAEEIISGINQYCGEGADYLFNLSGERDRFLRKIKSNWPSFAVEIFEIRTDLDVDLEQLQKEKKIEENRQQKEQDLGFFKQDLRKLLSTSEGVYPQTEITTRLETYFGVNDLKKAYADFEIAKFRELHQYILSEKWLELSDILFRDNIQADYQVYSLLSVMKQKFFDYFENWQRTFVDRTLYRSDIARIKDLMDSEYLSSYVLAELKEKVLAAGNAYKIAFNVSILAQCKELNIEPWMEASSSGTSVNSLKIFSEVSNEINQSHKEMIKIFDDQAGLNKRIDEIQKRKEEIGHLYSEVNRVSQEIEKRKKEIQEEFKEQQQNFQEVIERNQQYETLLNDLRKQKKYNLLSDWQIQELYLFAILQYINIGAFSKIEIFLGKFKEQIGNEKFTKHFALLNSWLMDFQEINAWNEEEKKALKELSVALGTTNCKEAEILFEKLKGHSEKIVFQYYKSRYEIECRLMDKLLGENIQKEIDKWDENLRLGKIEQAQSDCNEYRSNNEKELSTLLMGKIEDWKRKSRRVEAILDVVSGLNDRKIKNNREATMLYHQLSYILSLIVDHEELDIAKDAFQAKYF